MIKNKLYNINCITYMESVPDLSFDHTITDIPYDVVNRDSAGIRNFNKGDADILLFDLDNFLNLCIKKTKDKIFIFCSSEQVSEIVLFLNSNGFNTTLGIWEKNNPSPVNGQYLWLSGVECCVIGQRDKLDLNLINPIWRFPSGRSKDHPTEKPLSLMENIILSYTKENDLIYDPCAGSSSTLKAAALNSRFFIGNEIVEKYYENGIIKLDEYLNKDESIL